jgi:hypothetical protein
MVEAASNERATDVILHVIRHQNYELQAVWICAVWLL